MAGYVRSKPIRAPYFSDTETIGTDYGYDTHTPSIKWDHFSVELRDVYTGPKSIADVTGTAVSQRNVFHRALEEITQDAIESVTQLIDANTLYKGKEWDARLIKLLQHKIVFDAIESDYLKNNYSWEYCTAELAAIRNSSIGTLLQELSEGMDLETAVTRYEKITAPENYKRPKPVFTKAMLDRAKQTVTELGYMPALNRRFAVLEDISVRDVLYSNKDAAKQMKDAFSDLEAKVKPAQLPTGTEISIEDFIKDVLPTATKLEVMLENSHAKNFVSLIAPQDACKSMFKWDNNFSWAYTGNIAASSMKENVKKAGGNVNGLLRCSLQWNDNGDNRDDLDLHSESPYGHIYYGNKLRVLDVDIVEPKWVAVENQIFQQLKDGTYDFYVNNYCALGARSGFTAEIEFDGTIHEYSYPYALKYDENIALATVTYKDGKFSIKHHLDSKPVTKTVWNIATRDFTEVYTVCYSPNYWGDNAVGHKHYMFMLKGCENAERPNGFYNEFLSNELHEHRKVMEALSANMKVDYSDRQLSGVGFSSTKRDSLTVKVNGNVMTIKF